MYRKNYDRILVFKHKLRLAKVALILAAALVTLFCLADGVLADPPIDPYADSVNATNGNVTNGSDAVGGHQLLLADAVAKGDLGQRVAGLYDIHRLFLRQRGSSRRQRGGSRYD